MAFSVKSGFLSNITVETPNSFFSKRSTHTNISFAKYRSLGKSNAPNIKTANDIFEATSQRSFRSSKRESAPQPNTDVFAPIRTEDPYGGKYPFLQAYIDRGMGLRPHKKMRFQRENPDDYVEVQNIQRTEKINRELNERVDKILEERRLIRENRQRMITDQIFAIKEKTLKRHQLNDINERLKKDK